MNPLEDKPMLAATPAPPYYAVIFSSVRADADHETYGAMAKWMVELAHDQPGFLGVESAREEVGITVSYWRDLDAIKAWKRHADHMEAQRRGRSGFYRSFKTRIALVERDYGFELAGDQS